MLARIFSHLITTRSDVAISWLCAELKADSVAAFGMSEQRAHLTAMRNDASKEFFWDDQNLLRRLEGSKHSAAAFALLWELCRIADRCGDLHVMVRSYVKKKTGVLVESVPFLLTPEGLNLVCDRKSCSGSSKKSDQVLMSVDKNRLSVLVPIGNSEMHGLLFGRLRRISP